MEDFAVPQILFLSGELCDWIFHYLTAQLQPCSECLLAFSTSAWAEWMRPLFCSLRPEDDPDIRSLPKVQIWQLQLSAAPRARSPTHINSRTGPREPSNSPLTLRPFESFSFFRSEGNSSSDAAILPELRFDHWMATAKPSITDAEVALVNHVWRVEHRLNNYERQIGFLKADEIKGLLKCKRRKKK